MSLVQVELERRGIVTVSLSVMPDVTRRIGPPRALAVHAPLGWALGAPHDAVEQTRVLRQMLALTERHDTPVLETS